jgi:hypothetical protein
MLTLALLAEQHIREAQVRGEFDNRAGASLALDDDVLVPEEMRVAYRLLKNAGFVPPELDAHCEIRELKQVLQAVEDDGLTAPWSRASILCSGAASPASAMATCA